MAYDFWCTFVRYVDILGGTLLSHVLWRPIFCLGLFVVRTAAGLNTISCIVFRLHIFECLHCFFNPFFFVFSFYSSLNFHLLSSTELSSAFKYLLLFNDICGSVIWRRWKSNGEQESLIRPLVNRLPICLKYCYNLRVVFWNEKRYENDNTRCAKPRTICVWW